MRFTRGKGTFPTCDTCNNCNDLLSLSKSTYWTKQQREIVFAYKSLHLKQQAAERAALDAKKKIACSTRDVAGNPLYLVVLGDGRTVQACNTPKMGRRQSKKDTAFFTNRTFGVEVHCYGISGEILVHTDDLVRGGANFVIEVQRRIIIEVQHPPPLSPPPPSPLLNPSSSTRFAFAILSLS